VNISRSARSLFLFICIVFMKPTSAPAQPELVDTTGFGQKYLVRLTGTVLNEKFEGVKGLLQIGPPNPASLNDYFVMIVGYPTTNQRNTFFWNSDETEMITFSDELTCKIKRSCAKKVDSHFFYLSPILFKNKGAVTQHDEERKKHVEKTAKPIKVFGQAGELHLRFYSDEVTGNAWMTGYDTVERSYVRYQVSISGQRIQSGIEPRQEPRR